MWIVSIISVNRIALFTDLIDLFKIYWISTYNNMQTQIEKFRTERKKRDIRTQSGRLQHSSDMHMCYVVR